MASDQEYLKFILEQLSEADEITYRPMMGEYLLYYRGKLFGGIYDNRFLVKPVSSAVKMMEEAEYENPAGIVRYSALNRRNTAAAPQPHGRRRLPASSALP